MKIYQHAGGQGGMPGGMPNMSPEDAARMFAGMNAQKNGGGSSSSSGPKGPKVEEVD